MGTVPDGLRRTSPLPSLSEAEGKSPRASSEGASTGARARADPRRAGLLTESGSTAEGGKRQPANSSHPDAPARAQHPGRPLRPRAHAASQPGLQAKKRGPETASRTRGDAPQTHRGDSDTALLHSPNSLGPPHAASGGCLASPPSSAPREFRCPDGAGPRGAPRRRRSLRATFNCAASANGKERGAAVQK